MTSPRNGIDFARINLIFCHTSHYTCIHINADVRLSQLVAPSLTRPPITIKGFGHKAARVCSPNRPYGHFSRSRSPHAPRRQRSAPRSHAPTVSRKVSRIPTKRSCGIVSSARTLAGIVSCDDKELAPTLYHRPPNHRSHRACPFCLLLSP